MASEPMIVQAVYSFKGNNNDELCFQKGDKITITQKEEGGWWEGTFNGKTGWFPSNYVKECKDISVNSSIISQQQQYRAVVLKDLIDSEQAHVTELQGLVNNFLQPLEKSSILTQDEYKQLTGNLLEVLEVHQQLLSLLEGEENKSSNEQRVGRLFLTWAPKMKAVHQAYCSLHPKAVCIQDKYREDFTKYMEARGAPTPGILVLTTGLSKPFRRLDKYSNMLQELERHVEESHPDRGDTQRSVAVYKEIAATCAATRRQKDLELQVLTGPVRGWEGQSLATLGDIIYMGSVAVGLQHHDRYFVLFPSTLLILSVSHRLSAFIYEGNLPLSGITVIKLEDSEQYKNAFEISGPMIEKKIAICQSKEEANHWVDLLRKHMPRQSTASTNITSRLPSQADIVPQPPPHMTPLVSPGSLAINNLNRQGSFISNRGTTASFSSNSTINNNRGWSATSLRPAPPLRPCLALGPGPNGSPLRTNRKPMKHKEDAQILDIIESYCMAFKPRINFRSVSMELAECVKLKEENRNLAKEIQQLNNRVTGLEYSLNTLTALFNEEKAARSVLQSIVKGYITNVIKDPDTIDWPQTESYAT